ncbi:hypothetical protein DSLASN_06830 [Desulfoluna limicola]|uniref:Uncharacterized protein n=1 Tax=Desulfoluna limicola TaxID=2810562 RepID=A0ABN6EZL5_9BACT|nr:hypothetical protein DSLASN_06830 [Desulfoluna limicola]
MFSANACLRGNSSAHKTGLRVEGDEATFPDMSRVECIHIQDIRAAGAVVYLNALITRNWVHSPRPKGQNIEQETVTYMLCV